MGMQEEEKEAYPRVNEAGEAGRSKREEERGVVEEEEVVVVAR